MQTLELEVSQEARCVGGDGLAARAGEPEPTLVPLERLRVAGHTRELQDPGRLGLAPRKQVERCSG
jgi:hypothetical protein